MTEKLLLFFLHFGEALAAIYRTVFTGLEGNLCLCSAGCTGGCKHLSLFSGSVFTGVAAGLAALRLVDEAFSLVEFLLTGGKHKFGTAFLADKGFVFKHFFNLA